MNPKEVFALYVEEQTESLDDLVSIIRMRIAQGLLAAENVFVLSSVEPVIPSSDTSETIQRRLDEQ